MRNAGHSTISATSRPLRESTTIARTLLCLLLAWPAAAWAGEPADAGESPWSLGIALGHGRQYNPFVDSEDIDVNLVLDVAWYGERFFFDNGDFGFTLKESAGFSLSALATFNNERNYYSYLRNPASGLGALSTLENSGAGRDAAAEEEAAVPDLVATGGRGIFLGRADSALPKRRFAVNAGLELLYLSEWGDLQAQLLSDVSGVHNGQNAVLAYTRPWYTPSNEFALSLGMEWKSRELVDYYYGVRPEEALAGRPAWRGESGVNTFARFSASHSFNQHWKLVSVLEREFLSAGIRRSPIIDRDTIDTFYLGLFYQF